jgi:ribosomal-protein-alanine N-acetyltransferase
VSFCIRVMAAQDIDRVFMLTGKSVEAPHWSRRDYEQLVLVAPEAPPAPHLIRYSVVALCDGSLAGFAVASWLRQETAAEVEGLVVDDDYRRQGIGSALIEACVAWAANAGAASIRLEVRASNAAARALYCRHGFATVGTRRGYYSAPVEDAVVLQAPLNHSTASDLQFSAL